MSLSELHRWREFALTEPFLPERVDLMGALVTSTLANINRAKNSAAFSIEDFMIVANMRKVASNDDQEEQHFLSTMLALGGSASWTQ
jgi:hypothetical protein